MKHELRRVVCGLAVLVGPLGGGAAAVATQPLEMTLNRVALRDADVSWVAGALLRAGVRVSRESLEEDVMGVRHPTVTLSASGWRVQELLARTQGPLQYTHRVSHGVLNLIPLRALTLSAYPLDARVPGLTLHGATASKALHAVAKATNLDLVQWVAGRSFDVTTIPRFEIVPGGTVREALNRIVEAWHLGGWSAGVSLARQDPNPEAPKGRQIRPVVVIFHGSVFFPTLP